MNTWQAAQQLAYILRTLKWSDSPQNPVFGDVRVTQGPADDASGALRLPCAFVRVLDSMTDPDAPKLKTQKFEVVVVVGSVGDRVGEFALLGGQRTSTGKSAGRGLLELEEEMLDAINLINTSTNLFAIRAISTSAAEAALVEGHGYCVSRAYQFEAKLTTSRSFRPPNAGRKMTAAVNAGTVTLTFDVVERFDCHPAYSVPSIAARGGLVLVRKPGGTAPATVADGTIVSSTFATPKTDTPGSGTWSYALFGKHDEFNDGTTSIQYSTAVTASGVIVP